MRLLSQLADIGFAGSLIVLALAILAMGGHLRVALCWGSGMLLALVVVLAVKSTMVNDRSFPHFPSGHVALAVTFYGGLVLVLLRDEVPPGWWRPLLFFLILCAIGGIQGLSRVTLTEHGWVDVAGGLVAGIGGLVVTGNPRAWTSIARRDRIWLAGALVAAIPLNCMIYPHIDPLIRRAAGV
jgi:membrane-associated phospholipid phosphatase